jgi:hypothetical protein
VFPEKRLQAIENKGNVRRKGGKEATKRLQVDANKRVGVLERSKEGKSAPQGARSADAEIAEGTRGDRKKVQVIECTADN